MTTLAALAPGAHRCRCCLDWLPGAQRVAVHTDPAGKHPLCHDCAAAAPDRYGRAAARIAAALDPPARALHTHPASRAARTLMLAAAVSGVATATGPGVTYLHRSIDRQAQAIADAYMMLAGLPAAQQATLRGQAVRAVQLLTRAVPATPTHDAVLASRARHHRRVPPRPQALPASRIQRRHIG